MTDTAKKQKPKKAPIPKVPKGGPTDEMLMLAIRENLLELVALMNVGLARGIKTVFRVQNWEAQNPQNPDAPYTLMTLEMNKRFHNGQS